MHIFKIFLIWTELLQVATGIKSGFWNAAKIGKKLAACSQALDNQMQEELGTLLAALQTHLLVVVFFLLIPPVFI